MLYHAVIFMSVLNSVLACYDRYLLLHWMRSLCT